MEEEVVKEDEIEELEEVVELDEVGAGESGSGGSSGGGGVGGCRASSSSRFFVIKSSRDGRVFSRGFPSPNIRGEMTSGAGNPRTVVSTVIRRPPEPKKPDCQITKRTKDTMTRWR